MKDLQQLAIYGGGATLIILLLINIASIEALSPGVLVAVAILTVVILPIVIAVKQAKREKNSENS